MRKVLFLVKFFAIFALLHLALLYADLSLLENTIAATEAGTLGLVHDGNRIFFGSSTFTMGPSCTGLVSSIVLASIVLALKKPRLPKKVIILMAGSALLMLLNLARLYIVLLAGINFGSGAAETAHAATWFLTAGAVIIIWHGLTKKLCRTDSFGDFL